jgi:hypothetical protein
MSHAATTPASVVELGDEERDIVLWRLDQFARLGHADEDAWELAVSAADLGLARQLARAGCPTAVALRILL